MNPLTPEQSAQLHHLLVSGKKSDAVQLYRLWTGLDQRTAVEFISKFPIELQPGDPVRRSMVGWAIFAVIGFALILVPSYMLYGVFKPGPGAGLTGMGPPAVMPSAKPPANSTTPSVSSTPSPAVVNRPRRPATGPSAANMPPLSSAIFSGEMERALNMIDGGADVNAVATDGQNLTPLLTAAFRNNDEAIDVAQALIDKGANVNARANGGYSSLMLSVRHHSPQIVDLLIAHGADVNIANRRGETALDWAKQEDDTAAIDKLTKAGGKTGVELGVKQIPATTRPATRPAVRPKPTRSPTTLPGVER